MSNLPEEKTIKPKGIKKATAKKRRSTPAAELVTADILIESEAELCPYDENLLERARAQWQFGDWESLTHISRDTLQHHPDRAKLALLAAAGHLQLGDSSAARQFTRLAKDWGCNDKLISQILIAGVHNSLARASVASGQGARALKHFESAIVTGMPGGDTRLFMNARIREQFSQIGLPALDFEKMATSSIYPLPPSECAKHNPEIKQQNQSPNPQPTLTESAPEKSSDKKDTKQKFGSDANIDDFIDDLTPFFSSRSITYVDVGSFIGEVFLKLYHSKKINIREAHLYEPNPDSYQKLKQNISECSLPSMHAYNIAISTQSGDMLFSAAKSMTKHLDIPLDPDLVTNTFMTQCTALDNLISTFTDHHIDLLKIDVEGNEIDALTSASNLLKEQMVDVIYIEVGLNKNGTQQTYLINIDMFLQNYGYRVFKIYEQTNEWIQDSPLLRRCNVAYMSSRFAQANPYKLTIENHKLRQELANVKLHS